MVRGLLLLLAIVATSFVVQWLLDLDPLAVSPRDRLKPPSWNHWLGTDNFGRDLLSRLAAGAETSLLLAFQVTLLSSIIGTAFGVSAVFFPVLDSVLMRVCDGLLAIPAIILAAALAASFGPSVNNLVIALTIVFTPNIARVVRSRALVVKAETFVEASVAMGASSLHLMWRHILPNTLSVLSVQATFLFADAIITEAALSFLGAGVPTPAPSWGNILADGKTVLTRAPHMVFFAGAILVATILALNLIGDGMRDLTDKRSADKPVRLALLRRLFAISGSISKDEQRK